MRRATRDAEQTYSPRAQARQIDIPARIDEWRRDVPPLEAEKVRGSSPAAQETSADYRRRVLRDLRPGSARRAALPPAVSRDSRREAALDSGALYMYLVEKPLAAVSPRALGLKRTEIVRQARLVGLDILFTEDDRCFLQLVGAKEALVQGLKVVGKLPGPRLRTQWSPVVEEEGEAPKRANWTTWCDERATAVEVAWLEDRYASGSPADSPRRLAQADDEGNVSARYDGSRRSSPGSPPRPQPSSVKGAALRVESTPRAATGLPVSWSRRETTTDRSGGALRPAIGKVALPSKPPTRCQAKSGARTPEFGVAVGTSLSRR